MAQQPARKKRLRFVPEGPPNTVGLNIYPPISKAAISEFLLLPPDLQWRPATAFGIFMNAQPEIWHAGHVNAIIGIGDVAIVGSETGGVWLINPAYGAIPQYENFPARSLSWDWPNPHVNALAAGPAGPTIVYAGGAWLDGSNSSLHVLEFAKVLGGVEFVRSAEIAGPWDLSISQIVVQSTERRIVLAGDHGVWWSTIPADPTNVSGYSWRPAAGIPNGVSGLAPGPGSTLVGALYGDGMSPSNKSGFMVGTWMGNNLGFTWSTVVGGVPAMGRTSVASCKDRRSVLYAVAAAADDQFLGAVFRSEDGGKTFSPCQMPPGSGNLGWYNNCIDVHPNNADVVALGWRTGPFISADRGQTWANTSNSHLHSDVHAVTYAETSTGVNLWAGTDGGVCLSTDGGASWDSRYNKHLRNLQYYGPVDQLGMSTWDTSRWHDGLHGGATQDNGNLWTRAGDEGIRSAVRQFEGGDGNTVMFVTDTIALHRNNTLTTGTTEIGNRIRRSNYRPATYDMDDPIGVVVPAEGYPDGLPTPSAACVVTDPRYRRDGVRMLAVFGVGTELHGYFDTAYPGNMRKLADVGLGSSTAADPRNITAVASLDGYRVLAGTSDGHIYSVDSATGSLTDQTTSFGGWSDRKVSRLLWPTTYVRYATIDNWAVARWMPQLQVAVDGRRGTWVITKGLLTSGATDLEYADLATGGSALFATTDYGVEVSIDDGNSWTVISRGLPKRPHCRDIRLGSNGDGRPALFVGTYGWGAFMAELPRKPEGKFGHIPDVVAETLFGIIAGGDGVEIVGGHVKVVPPHEPARALAVALVMLAVSQRSSEETATLAERSAVEALRIAGIDGIGGLVQLMESGRAGSAKDQNPDDESEPDGGVGSEDSPAAE